MKLFRLSGIAVLLLTISSAYSQPPPGRGNPQGEGPPSPAVMAKFRSFQQWNANHTHYRELQRTVSGMMRLDENPKTKVTPAQASTILKTYNAWKVKPKLTDAEASTVQKAFLAALTNQQRKALDSTRVFDGRPRPGGTGRGNGEGRPGGRPNMPPSKGTGTFTGKVKIIGGSLDPNKMPRPKEFNPLIPASSPFAKVNPQMAQRQTQRMNQFISMLKSRASGVSSAKRR